MKSILSKLKEKLNPPKPVCDCPIGSLVYLNGVNHEGKKMYWCRLHEQSRLFVPNGKKSTALPKE